MTDLRDARLKKALDHAPDDAGAPPDAVRAAIHAHAAAQLRPALKAELPAAQPAPARPSFWRWLGGAGGGKHRQPWNAAFATLLLAGFVTLVVRYEQDEAPQEISGSVPTAKPLAKSPAPAPAPAPAVPAEPSRQATAIPPAANQVVQQRRLAATADARSDAAVPSAKKAAPATLSKQEEAAPAAERRAEAEQTVSRADSGVPAPGATAMFVPPPPPVAAVAVAPAAAPANIVGGAVAPAPAPQSAPVAQPFPSTSAAAPVVAQDARRESPAPAAAVGALAAPKLAVTGQRSRIDTQALRLQVSEWQTLSVRQGARVRDYTREQAAEVAGLLAGMPLVRVVQLAVFDNEPNQLVVLKRDDGSAVAALTLTRDVLQGTLVVEGLGPQTVAAADAAQVARLRVLLERLAAAPTAR